VVTLKGKPCDGSDEEAAEGDTRLAVLIFNFLQHYVLFYVR